jgi:hypothetical protein
MATVSEVAFAQLTDGDKTKTDHPVRVYRDGVSVSSATESARAPPRLREDVRPADYHFGGIPVLAEWIAGRGAARFGPLLPGLDGKDEQ